MDIAVWGPRALTFLHAVTFAYPQSPSPRQRRDYHGFFQAVSRVLPCAVCARHFAARIDALSPESDVFGSRATLTRWLYEVHDDVNLQTGKLRPSFAAVQTEFAPLGEGRRVSWSRLRAGDQVPIIALATLGAFAILSVVIGSRCELAHGRASKCARQVR